MNLVLVIFFWLLEVEINLDLDISIALLFNTVLYHCIYLGISLIDYLIV